MSDTRHLAASAPRGSFAIEPRGEFSLASSIRFLKGFEPARFRDDAGGGASGGTGGGTSGDTATGEAAGDAESEAAGAGDSDTPTRLDVAFALEGSWQTVGVSIDQSPTGTVRGRLFAEAPLKRAELSAARAQVERILSLDVDGRGFAAIGEADPVVGALQQRYPGLRPVCFWSWYEAAAWSIIGQRTRMAQAAVVKERLALELGRSVTVNGVSRTAFPAPAVLMGLESFPGLTAAKVERLRALGEAARRNVFDSASLRAMPREEAFAALQQMPGIGPFSAEVVLLRGAGDPDHAPVTMTRFAEAVAHAYDLDEVPDADALTALSKGWAPYRTWVTLLLRVQLDEALRSTGRGRQREAT